MKESTYWNKVKNIKTKAAMSKPVGKVLDSKAGKAGVKVGDAVIKGVKAPGKFIKKQWNKNQAYKNKFDTKEKYDSYLRQSEMQGERKRRQTK